MEVSEGAAALPEEESSIWSRKFRPLTLGLLLITVGSAFEQLSVATTMPVASSDLGGLSLYGWAFSGFMLAMVVSLTIGGGEVDRVGPWRPFILGTSLFAIGLAIAGLAGNMPVFIAGRVVQGFGAGFVSSVLYATVGEVYPDALRPRMLAFISSAYTVPSLAGPALAGFIAEYIGWRWVFLGLIPALPIAAIASRSMRSLTRQSTGSPNWARIGRALGLALGVGCLTIGMERFAGEGANGQDLVVTSALMGLGLVAAAVSLRGLLPTTSRGGFGITVPVFIALLLNMGFFGVDAFLPLSLVSVKGVSTSYSGLVLTAASICWIGGAWLQAQLAPRHSRRVLIGAGLGLVAAGVVGIVAVLQPGIPVYWAFAVWAVGGLGMGFAFPTISLLGMELAPPGAQGVNTSAITLAGILGIALGTSVGGVLVGAGAAGGSALEAGIIAHSLIMAGALCFALVAFVRQLPHRVMA